MITRRTLLKGLIAVPAAPAIVRIENIMPIQVPKIVLPEIEWMLNEPGSGFDNFSELGSLGWKMKLGDVQKYGNWMVFTDDVIVEELKKHMLETQIIPIMKQYG